MLSSCPFERIGPKTVHIYVKYHKLNDKIYKFESCTDSNINHKTANYPRTIKYARIGEVHVIKGDAYVRAEEIIRELKIKICEKYSVVPKILSIIDEVIKWCTEITRVTDNEIQFKRKVAERRSAGLYVPRNLFYHNNNPYIMACGDTYHIEVITMNHALAVACIDTTNSAFWLWLSEQFSE